MTLDVELQPSEGDAEHVLPEGTIVEERYRIDRLLGHGAMGSVYRALQISVERPVAIKVLSPDLSARPTIRRRFRAEARAASAAGHPNIIEVFDAGELPDGRPYIVMELLDGRELLAELREHGPMTLARACWIIRDVARALHAAHQVGIVHRDLKAENVFLVQRDDRETVKVLDFGVAHGVTEGQRVTTPGLAMGTPEYMAPEQAYGAPAKPTFDIYALGVLLFELLAGEPPFVADNPIELLGKKAANPAPSIRERRDDLPDALVELVAACLDVDPERRPHSADEVATRLNEIALDPFAPPPAKTRGGLDGWVVLVAVTMVCLAALGIAWTYGSEPDEGPVVHETVRTSDPGQVRQVPLETRSATPTSQPQPQPAFSVPEAGIYERAPNPSVAVATHAELASQASSQRASLSRPKPVNARDSVGSPPDGIELASGGSEAIPDSSACQLRRRQAHEARANQDWEGILRYTSTAGCWSSVRERDKLRVKAYMELQEFDQCAAMGGPSMDPEVQRWVRLCEKRNQ